MSRIKECFCGLGKKGQKALIPFITAHDPDFITCLTLLKLLPTVGADLIEIGMPFSDPMSDGPAIQASSQRSLKSGGSMQQTLRLVEAFRKENTITPVILMGYYNPLYRYGVDRFLQEEAFRQGVDGLILVDLPPEADNEVFTPAQASHIDFIRLVTPTTHDLRLPFVLRHATGFVYYVSITGVTGTTTAPEEVIVRTAITRLRQYTSLPIAVGFGIRTPEQVARLSRHVDAVVLGSALVERIASSLDEQGKPQKNLIPDVLRFVESLKEAQREFVF